MKTTKRYFAILATLPSPEHSFPITFGGQLIVTAREDGEVFYNLIAPNRLKPHADFICGATLLVARGESDGQRLFRMGEDATETLRLKVTEESVDAGERRRERVEKLGLQWLRRLSESTIKSWFA